MYLHFAGYKAKVLLGIVLFFVYKNPLNVKIKFSPLNNCLEIGISPFEILELYVICRFVNIGRYPIPSPIKLFWLLIRIWSQFWVRIFFLEKYKNRIVEILHYLSSSESSLSEERSFNKSAKCLI